MADTNTTGRRDVTRKMYKLIEDVARAIETAKAHPGDCLVEVQAQRAIAVVLASLQEPTEGMTEVGDKVLFSLREELAPMDVWQVMLSQWAKEQGL